MVKPPCKTRKTHPVLYPPRSIHPYDQNVLEKIFVSASRLSTNEIPAYFAHSPIDRRHDIRRMSTYIIRNERTREFKCSSVQSVMEQRIEDMCIGF
jgi:hypothetical protein